MLLTAAQASSPYTGPLVTYCLIAGGVFLVAGMLIALFVDLPAQRATQKAAKKAATAAKTAAPDATGKVDAEAQGAIVDVADSVSKLAASMKDLTVAMRLAMIGVFLVALAAAATGADALGQAGSDTSSTTTTTTTVPKKAPTPTTAKAP